MKSFLTAVVATVSLVVSSATSVHAAAAAPVPAVEGGDQVVTFDGMSVTVPAAWPVVDPGAQPTACVRLDQHAAYLGLQGPAARCPAHAIGRTEAVQLLTAAQAATLAAGIGSSAGSAGSATETRVVAPDGRVVVVTYAERTAVVDAIVAGLRFDAPVVADEEAASPSTPSVAGSAANGSHASVGADRGAGGGEATVAPGEGFDTCSTPSQAAMDAWTGTSGFRTVGVYIGGMNIACSQPNLTAGWIRTQIANGWSIIPTYVGRLPPCSQIGSAKIDPAKAATQGSDAAKDAIAAADVIGLGPGTPIYEDLEYFDQTIASCANAAATFISAWTAELHARGYLAGAYSSAASGAPAIITRYGAAGFHTPDDIWIAHWDGVDSESDAVLQASKWAGHRIRQYRGFHDETHGGVTLTVDSNFVHADVAGKSTTAEPAPVTNLLANPSWESSTNFSSWMTFPSGPVGHATVTAAGAKDGVRWGRINAPDAGGSSVAQTVVVTPRAGQRYSFGVWFRSPSGSTVTGRLTVRGTGPAPRSSSTTFTARSGWSHATATFDPTTTYAGIQVEISVNQRDVDLDLDLASLVQSPGFAPFRSWDAFVAQQSKDFGGSPGSVATRAASVDQLTRYKLSPSAFVQHQIAAPRFAPHVAPVTRLYWAFFGRVPDYGGLTYWSGAHRRGTDLSVIAQSLAASHEFRAKYGVLSNRAFVTRIYADVLGRKPDTSGVAYWTKELDSRSRTRGQVMVGFSQSSEYVDKKAEDVNTVMAFVGMLHRSPTAAEVVGRRGQGFGPVIEGLRRSASYAARVA